MLLSLLVAVEPSMVAAIPSAECTIVGTSGPDELTGTPGPDVICGRGGDDVIRGRGGDDRLFGDSGNDVLYGQSGNDALFGGGGNDIVRGGAGNDEVIGGAGDDAISGGSGSDVLRGGAGVDDLRGGQGNDELRGGAGDDVLRGGVGDDVLRGGVGDDQLFGGNGVDEARGNGGEDSCRAEDESGCEYNPAEALGTPDDYVAPLYVARETVDSVFSAVEPVVSDPVPAVATVNAEALAPTILDLLDPLGGGLVDLGDGVIEAAWSATDPLSVPLLLQAAAVDLEVLSEAETAATGFDKVAVRVAPSSVVTDALASGDGELTIGIDYSTFRWARGGLWDERLQLYWMEPCWIDATTSGQEPGESCPVPMPLDSTNDVGAGLVTAALPAALFEPPVLLAVEDGADSEVAEESDLPAGFRARRGVVRQSGGSGGGAVGLGSTAQSPGSNYERTSLSASQRWSVGLNGGTFAWNYTLPIPTVPSGPVPDVTLNYDSGRMDGLSADQNSQGGMLPNGWALNDTAYIERVCCTDW